MPVSDYVLEFPHNVFGQLFTKKSEAAKFLPCTFIFDNLPMHL